MREFSSPLDKKHAAYEMASKAELTDYRAKVWFNRPAYGIYQGRRENDGRDDGDRQTGVHYSDEGDE